MLRLLPCLLLFLVAVPAGAEADEPPVPVVKVAVTASEKSAPRALRYPLLPDPLDLTPDNAALVWVRAGRLAKGATAEIKPKQLDDWGGGLALDKLPRAEVREALKGAGPLLRLADRAARCERCEWEYGALTFQNVTRVLDEMLGEVQALRELAALLSLQCRLQLSEGDFAGADRTLQTLLSLGRQLGRGPMLIQSLVGIAITGVALARIEEWIGLPGSPNLYWSLTALPRPLIDVRHAVRYELDSLYRSFPALRRLEDEKPDARQVHAIVRELIQSLGEFGRSVPKGWDTDVAVGLLAARAYPDAKKYLLDQGIPRAKVEAMPALQVVLLQLLARYDRARDDTLKWMSVPYWQGAAGLERVEKQIRDGGQAPTDVALRLLMPAVTRVHLAGVRIDRQVAALRTVEAVRVHAAADGGKLPVKLTAVRAVPLPSDPVTGKSFEDAYKAEGGKAVLELRPVAGKPSLQPRRYELSESK